MIINQNEIHIFRTSTDLNENELNSFRKNLSDDENTKAERYKFNYLKNNYTACRGFLREILSGYTGINPSDIKFSYSKFTQQQLLLWPGEVHSPKGKNR